MVDRSQVQVTIAWAKVTHESRVKRISKPAQDLATFVGQVRAHFKELAEVEYLYDLNTNEINQNPYKNKFVIRWQSQSPTDASILDQSCNAVEVNTQDQYFEILCTHAIVDRSNGRISTPRFYVYVIEPTNNNPSSAKSPEKQIAPTSNSVENQVQVLQALNDMSPLMPRGSQEEEESKDSVAAAIGAGRAAGTSELNQSVPVSVAEDDEDEEYFVVEGNEDSDEDRANINKALEREEDQIKDKDAKPVVVGANEQEDPAKVKASAVIKSMFGEEAEDAVSLEAISDADAESEEAISVVEETYSVGGADNEEAAVNLDGGDGKAPRDSLPFQMAEDLAGDGAQEEKKAVEQIAHEMAKGAAEQADDPTNNMQKEDQLAQVINEINVNAAVLAEEDNQPAFGDEAPKSSRLESIALPKPDDGIVHGSNQEDEQPEEISISKKLSSIQLPEQNQDQEEVKVQKDDKKVQQDGDSSGESSSSDSDFDMFEAFEQSQELQTILRQYIRNELQTLGPQIYAKIQSEHNSELRQPPVDSSEDEVDEQEESKDVARQQEEEKNVIDNMLGDTEVKSPKMRGGWGTQHIHSSLAQPESSFEEAPDKEIGPAIQQNDANDLPDMDEPVIVDPQFDSEAMRRDRQFAEKYINIRLKATMDQDEVKEGISQQQKSKKQDQKKKGFFQDLVQGVKTLAKEVFDQSEAKRPLTQVAIANGPEFAEVYTEVTRTEGKRAHARVIWKLRNLNEQHKWPENLQIVPCCSFPTLRIHFESNICQLESQTEGTLKLHVQIPEDYRANHLILLLKMRDPKGYFIGPNLLLFIKVINQKAREHEISSFAVESGSDDLTNTAIMNGRSSMDVRQEQIERGMDVYTEQQLLSMGSILADEGFGSFDRCMIMLRVLRGDIENARQLLSSLIQTESQIA